MPTGGVDTTEESINSWIKAGVACVGMGSKLIPKETLDSGNYSDITENVKQVIDWIQNARAGKSPIA